VKEEEQYLMTRFTVVGFALQGCLTASTGWMNCYAATVAFKQMSYFPFSPLVKAA